MKILQIGAGGIGSFLAREVVACVGQGQINSMIEYTIADDDIVEIEQITYQNFKFEDAGINKAKALADNLCIEGISWINSSKKRISILKDLKGYDLFILCVDNDVARRLVIDYCFKNNKEFIDLRATGRNIMAIPKLRVIGDNMKFVDVNDAKTYSCQDKNDLAKGYIQKGNIIVAMIGIQMLLNHLRGHTSRPISMVI